MYNDIFQLYKLLTENEVFIANYTFPNEDSIIERLSNKYSTSETFIFSDLVKIEDMKYKANEVTISLVLKYNILIILEDGGQIIEPVNDIMTIIEKGKCAVSRLNLMSKENIRKLLNKTFFKSKQNQNFADVEYFISLENICLNCIKLSDINHSEVFAIWKKLIDEKIKLTKQVGIRMSINVYNPYENKTHKLSVHTNTHNTDISTTQIHDKLNKIDYWLARINYTSFLGDKHQFLEHSITN